MWNEADIVSFQDNAWVDTPTYIDVLKSVVGRINERIRQMVGDLKGLTLEDDLFIHLTDASLNC